MGETSPHDGMTQAERTRIVVAVLLVMMLAALDQTIVSPALPTIGAGLGDAAYLSWIISAYFLTATAVTPLYGKIADIKGRRPVLLAAVAIFVLGSIACALAPTMLALILGRALQGLGGGGLISLAQTVIGDVVAPRDRGRYMIYISAVWATASIAGPVMGGVFAQHLNWSMIFWINLPLAGAAVAVSWQTLKRLPPVHRPHKLDFLGAGLVVAATTTFLLAFTWGGSAYAWASPVILGLLGLTAALISVTAWHLTRTDEAIIPMRVLANPVVMLSTLCVFCSTGGYIGISVFSPLYFELAYGLDTAASGLGLVGFMVGTVLGANLGGRFMTRVPSYKAMVLWTGLGGLIVVALLALTAGWLTFALVEVLIFLFGMSIGVQFPVCTVAVQNAVEPSDLGAATATLSFMRSLGSVIGIAVLGAVLLSQGIVQSLGEGAKAAAHAADQAAAAHAFSIVFGMTGAMLLLGLTFYAFVEEQPLRGRVHRAEAQHPPIEA
ncbi:MAG: MFS transporter [Ancalomicrobiaceae bacterium]|nr:MFS transporter [Ancalomicrobiaceae bacterium]